jgi:predicted metal-dependent hydrolase
MTQRTPSDHKITPRDMKFVRDANPRWWANNDPIATAFWNALSATFPHGEKFFMDSVRHFRDQVSPALQEQIKGFITQEAIHTREHLAFNRIVSDHGYVIDEIDAQNKADLDEARQEHPIGQLAITMGLEHFTAILAHALLTDERHLAGAPKEVRDLWRWHAMEEIEHKAVAFDTYMEAMKDASAFERWKIRCLVMVRTTWDLAVFQKWAIGKLLAQDGIDIKKARWRLLKFLLVEAGIIRSIARAYLTYFLPGFHPWRMDDRNLLAAEETRLAAAA